MKAICVYLKSCFALIVVVLLLASCGFEQAGDGEAQISAIPVSHFWDGYNNFATLFELGAPWVGLDDDGEIREFPNKPHLYLSLVFQANDGTDMLYATVITHSAGLFSEIQAYDPASGAIFTQNQLGRRNYSFRMYENELFVVDYITPHIYPYEEFLRVYRPVLNHETFSFDLVEVDEELFALIEREIRNQSQERENRRQERLNQQQE